MAATWLKSLTCFNLVNFPALSVSDFNDALSQQAFTPCGTYDREQHGFIPAFGLEDMVRKVGEVFWLQMKSQKKVVPGAAVKRALDERVADIEARELRKVSKKEKKALKEEVIDELVASALSTESIVTIMIDPENKRLLLGTSSNKVIEKVYELLLQCFQFEAERADFGNAVQLQMSDLLLNGDSSVFITDSTLVLKGTSMPAPTVRFAKHNLAAEQVSAHIAAGMRPSELELGWNGRISFILTDTFGLKKIKYLDVIMTPFEEALPEAPEEVLDATLALQAGELTDLLKDLIEWIGSAPQED